MRLPNLEKQNHPKRDRNLFNNEENNKIMYYTGFNLESENLKIYRKLTVHPKFINQLSHQFAKLNLLQEDYFSDNLLHRRVKAISYVPEVKSIITRKVIKVMGSLG